MKKLYDLGNITTLDAHDVAFEYSPTDNGLYVLYPDFKGEKHCYLELEYDDEDNYVWGRIYTEDNLPDYLKEIESEEFDWKRINYED